MVAGFMISQELASFANSTGSEPDFTMRMESICFPSTETSLGASGVLDLASVEGCLFDHQIAPPKMARTPIAVKSPPAFMWVSSLFQLVHEWRPESSRDGARWTRIARPLN